MYTAVQRNQVPGRGLLLLYCCTVWYEVPDGECRKWYRTLHTVISYDTQILALLRVVLQQIGRAPAWVARPLGDAFNAQAVRQEALLLSFSCSTLFPVSTAHARSFSRFFLSQTAQHNGCCYSRVAAPQQASYSSSYSSTTSRANNEQARLHRAATQRLFLLLRRYE